MLRRINRLISQPTLRKFLAYSVGEIFLITIGIMVALQVNNWNENRKLSQLEHKLLRELKENLKLDLNDIDLNLKANDQLVTIYGVVLKQLDENRPYHDSLGIYYASLLRHTSFMANVSAYENLKSLGFNLITDDSLRIMISSLYAAKYKYITDFEQNYADKFQFEQIYPSVLKRVRIVRFRKEAYPFHPETLSSDDEFKELLRTNMVFRKYILGNYIEVDEYVNELIKRIDVYLDMK